MNSSRPNLFSYATKELSQDALICWLIAWAGESKGGSSEEKELRCCGVRFVRALLNHKRDEMDLIKLENVDKVEIYQQEQGIDILARINDEHVLLIEDKTDTDDHSDQLSRYYTNVVEGRTKLGKVSETDLRPIYFKMGNQSLKGERRIENEEGYKVFTRKDVLKVLDGCEGRNAILSDFRKYLQGLEEQTNRYLEWTQMDDKESWWAWEGFYRHLESELITSSGCWTWWGYVHNRSGGFLGFSWAASVSDELYLQIEAHLESGIVTKATLCFKVYAGNKSNSRKQDLKWDWHRRVLKASRGQAVKPAYMRIGETMTVAWWQTDWMAFGKDGKLDMSGTVKNLKHVETVVRAAISSS